MSNEAVVGKEAGAAPRIRHYEIVPGAWKLACAFAVLCGHNLVTLKGWRSDEPAWGWILHVFQFFSPLQFLFFSGYLAASGIVDVRRGMREMVVSRAVRVYALAVTALVWGLLVRAVIATTAGGPAQDEPWPLRFWNGPVDWMEVLRHLNPFGFADHVSFNYGVWYLYQELRIAFLLPAFRWILLRPALRARAALLLGSLVAAIVLEHVFWSWFPMFRSSPFQTIGYGCCFLAGAIVWMERREGGILHRVGRTKAILLIGAGLIVSYAESAGITPPVDNPIVLMVPTLVGQILLVAGLLPFAHGFATPAAVRSLCDTSAGIYIVHPPIHIACAWIAVRAGSPWPIAVGILLSIAIGAFYHRFVEQPSLGIAKWAGRLAAVRQNRADLA